MRGYVSRTVSSPDSSSVAISRRRISRVGALVRRDFLRTESTDVPIIHSQSDDGPFCFLAMAVCTDGDRCARLESEVESDGRDIECSLQEEQGRNVRMKMETQNYLLQWAEFQNDDN